VQPRRLRSPNPVCVMNLDVLSIGLQTALLLLLAPLITGCIRNWKAKLQNRRGPRVWQPYFDLIKFLRKDMVISEHASWVFSAAPYIVFITALLVGLMVPMVTVQAPLSLFGGVLAVVGLLALGRFFMALGGLDPASAFGGMGSSREMTIAAIAEPALMLAIFTVAITVGSTDFSHIVATAQQPGWNLFNPAHLMAFAALFVVLLAETGRIPIDNPSTHLELTMIHEAMLLEYSGRYLAFMEWGAAIKQLVLMTLLANVFLPVGIATEAGSAALGVSLLLYVGKLLALSAAVVLVETTNAKLRLFRVPDLLSAALALATLALFSTFLFQ
jgi:formate hydrogenlyase subunit 4